MKDETPAFPATNYIIPKDLEERHVAALGKTRGMTLRDYLAAKAMAAEIGRGYGNFEASLAWIVPRAYQWADAMLAERKKNG